MQEPQFEGVIVGASNIQEEEGSYTRCMFYEDFPQFFNGGGECLLPESLLSMFINLANKSIAPDRWAEWWRYGCGLFVAHYVTLNLRTFKEASSTPEEAAASGTLTGVVKRATLGDSSVEYDTSSLSSTSAWGDLNATQYGQTLAARARLVGMGGSYVL